MTRRPFVLALLLLLPPTAHAQEQEPGAPPKIQAAQDDRPSLLAGLGVGPGVDTIVPTSGRASVSVVPRLSLRFPARRGFSPTVGFGWFDTSLEGDQFGREERIGELQLRPIMGGVRYTWLRDAYSYDVAATAGWSFSDFDLDGQVAGRLPAPGNVVAQANTSFAWKIQGGLWYDHTDRVAFRATVGYFHCTPEITVTAGGQSRRFSQSGSAVQLGASVVYRLF